MFSVASANSPCGKFSTASTLVSCSTGAAASGATAAEASLLVGELALFEAEAATLAAPIFSVLLLAVKDETIRVGLGPCLDVGVLGADGNLEAGELGGVWPTLFTTGKRAAAGFAVMLGFTD